MSVENTNSSMTRRKFLTIAAGTAVALAGCGKTPEHLKQPDKRYITHAQWIVDNQGRVAIQEGNTLRIGARLDLQKQNEAALTRLDLTASPYNGSLADPTLNRKGGYPILGLADVETKDGKLVLAEKNDHIKIENLPNGTVELYFTIDLNNPSGTDISQPPIPDGERVLLEIDAHGKEQGYKDQLNVAGGWAFTRQPNVSSNVKPVFLFNG